MKTTSLFLFVFLFSFPFFINGQDTESIHKKREEMIKAEKIAFFTQQLNITSEEATVFWPVYYEYQNKREALFKERKIMIDKLKDDEATLTDKEIEVLTDKITLFEFKEAELLQEYYQKFKKVLPIKKVAKLHYVEQKFKHYLLKQIRGNHAPAHDKEFRKGPMDID